MPGLRVGFLVADRPLAGELLPYKRYMDVGGPSLTQAIAAEFLRDGYDQHLETIRAIYRERRDVALAALKEQMPDGVAWTRPQGGFQLWVTLPRQVSSVQLFLDADRAGRRDQSRAGRRYRRPLFELLPPRLRSCHARRDSRRDRAAGGNCRKACRPRRRRQQRARNKSVRSIQNG